MSDAFYQALSMKCDSLPRASKVKAARWEFNKTVEQFSIVLAKPIRKNRFCFLNYSEKSIFRSEKSISVLKVFGKIDFHYAGEVTHPNVQEDAW